MKRTHVKGIVAAASVAVLGIVSSAPANPIAYEDFSTYSSGTLNSADNGGSGWTGGWVTSSSWANATVATAPSTFVSPDPNDVASDQVATFGKASLEYRGMNTTIAAGSGSTASPDSVFVSILIQRQVAGTGSSLLSLYNDTAGDTIIGSIGVSSAYNADWNLFVGSSATQSTVPANNTNTTLLVAELDYKGGGGKDTVELYINPTGTTASTAQQTLSLSSQTLGSFGAVRLYSDASTITDYSNLVVGQTFADVVDVTPEPCSIVTLLAPMALLGLRRRRRNAQVGIS